MMLLMMFTVVRIVEMLTKILSRMFTVVREEEMIMMMMMMMMLSHSSAGRAVARETHHT